MKHDAEHQLRELIRNVIREELKSREVKKDTETGVTTSDLEDKEGKKVGYMKHTTDPQTGGLVAAGRIGPKAAEKEVDETTDTSSDNEEPKKDDSEEKPKRPRRRKDTRSIEQKSRDMGQIEMFEERLRETSTYKLKTNQTEARLTPDDAKGILDKHDAHDDFHALKSDKVSALLGAAKDAKYRRRSDAPGSKARMFHQHLTRLAGKVKEGNAVATAAPDPDEEGEGKYNPDAVDKAIQASNRAGRRIGKSEADKIHRLLKGWRGNKPSDKKEDSNESLVVHLDKLRQTPTYKQILLGSHNEDNHNLDGMSGNDDDEYAEYDNLPTKGSMSSGKGSPVNNNMATKKGVEAAINAHRNRGSANEGSSKSKRLKNLRASKEGKKLRNAYNMHSPHGEKSEEEAQLRTGRMYSQDPLATKLNMAIGLEPHKNVGFFRGR